MQRMNILVRRANHKDRLYTRAVQTHVQDTTHQDRLLHRNSPQQEAAVDGRVGAHAKRHGKWKQNDDWGKISTQVLSDSRIESSNSTLSCTKAWSNSSIGDDRPAQDWNCKIYTYYEEWECCVSNSFSVDQEWVVCWLPWGGRDLSFLKAMYRD